MPEGAPQAKPPSMTEIFERLCPYYMMYGMTYDQYWFGDPWDMRFYKQKHDLLNRKRNEELWLQGIYVFNAFGVVLSNAFARKGSTPKKYLQKPLDIFPKSKEEREAEAEAERRKIVAAFTLWGKNWNAKHGDSNE